MSEATEQDTRVSCQSMGSWDPGRPNQEGLKGPAAAALPRGCMAGVGFWLQDSASGVLCLTHSVRKPVVLHLLTGPKGPEKSQVYSRRVRITNTSSLPEKD